MMKPRVEALVAFGAGRADGIGLIIGVGLTTS